MAGGRKRSPTHLRVIKGNPGCQKFNKREPKPARVCPPPPDHLSEAAKTAWLSLSTTLFNMGVLTEGDMDALESASEALAELREARRIIQTEGSCYDVTNERGVTYKRAHPVMTQLADADRRLRAWLTEFGLTPASRSKVSVAHDVTQEDPAERYFG